jgi:hypothetical protein
MTTVKFSLNKKKLFFQSHPEVPQVSWGEASINPGGHPGVKVIKIFLADEDAEQQEIFTKLGFQALSNILG